MGGKGKILKCILEIYLHRIFEEIHVPRTGEERRKGAERTLEKKARRKDRAEGKFGKDRREK